MKKLFYIPLVCCLLTISCNDDEEPVTNIPVVSGPPFIQYTVLNKYPHDTASWTQGLTFYNGQLFESTGSPDVIANNGSWLGPVELATGKAQKNIKLDTQYFGEGMTILNDRIYYITWQSKKGFVYDAKTFKKLKEFNYNTEGWGLATDGNFVIMSDGSSNLYYYNPETLTVEKTITVTDNNGPVANINELEYINGFVYANQWETPYILKIELPSGKVVGRINVDILLKEASTAYLDAEVVNGIAFDSTSGKMYITGKKWPSLYEIQLR